MNNYKIIIPQGTEAIFKREFKGEKIQSVIIPSSVTTIGDYAFDGCSKLSTVIFECPEKIQSIGYCAFRDCEILEYNIYSNAKYLGSKENPFSILIKATSNDISSCEIHPDTTYVCENAFWACTSLTSVTIPNSVKVIGNSAFDSCESLASLIFNKDSKLMHIGARAFCHCRLTSVTIPNSVKTIGNDAFGGNWLESLTLPFVVDGPYKIEIKETFDCSILKEVIVLGGTEISTFAFKHMDFKNIELPESIIIINSQAFYSCKKLTNIKFPSNLQIIGNSAFESGSLNEIRIPSSIKTIGKSAFNCCFDLTKVFFEEGSKVSLGDYAFCNCHNLTKISISSNLKKLGRGVFQDCKNLEFNIYDNAKYLGNDTNPYIILVSAVSKDITSCIIHPSTKFIIECSFADCDNIDEINIPEGVISIGERAFSSSGKKSKKIIVPLSLKACGYEALSGNDIYYRGSQDQMNKIKFDISPYRFTNRNIIFNYKGN